MTDEQVQEPRKPKGLGLGHRPNHALERRLPVLIGLNVCVIFACFSLWNFREFLPEELRVITVLGTLGGVLCLGFSVWLVADVRAGISRRGDSGSDEEEPTDDGPLDAP